MYHPHAMATDLTCYKAGCCDRGDCVDLVTSYLVFGIGPSFVHRGVHLFSIYIIYSRMTVLYFGCRVNRGTTLSICCLC